MDDGAGGEEREGVVAPAIDIYRALEHLASLGTAPLDGCTALGIGEAVKTAEVDVVRLRPHPAEFSLYFDA